MPYRVKDQENWQAEILVVGEAPGREEMAHGWPFMGESGNYLKEWWRHAGIKREDLFISNVLDTMPNSQGGDINEACKRDRGLAERIREQEIPRLRRLATDLPNLKVIVCVGNYATRAFTRYGQIYSDDKSPGITSVRGSVYPFRAGDRTVYCIPTIHPAAVMRQPEWERRCILDWRKAARIRDQGWTEVERTHLIYPTIDEIAAYKDSITANDVVSFDIETWGNSIKCVGFAMDERHSIVIPTELWAWEKIEGSTKRAKQALILAWQCIQDICQDPGDKVAQGGLFDCWWLAQPEYGIRVQGYHWDTMAMHHALAPNESHALDFLASIFTDEPYWKDGAKDAETITKAARQNMDKLYIYNGLDVTVTWEIFAVLHDMLVEQDMLSFYLRHYADMHDPLLTLMLTGAPINRELVVESRRAYLADAVSFRDEASLIAGKPLFKFDGTQLERAMLADYYVNGPGIPLGHDVEPWLQQFLDATKTLKNGTVKPAYPEDSVYKKWDSLQDKGISDDLLNKVLYGDWKCPTGKYTKTGKEKADNVALKTLRNNVKDRKRGGFMEHQADILRLIDVVMEHRRKRKLASFVQQKRLDDDDRMRCTYKFITKTGRLSSAANPRGTGTNLQNQDREIRYIFVASPGRVLIECDLSQAEGRVVKALSGNKRAIEQAKRLPTDGDEHTENAVAIFSAFYQKPVAFDEITYPLRQIGKKVVHASNYDQGKFGLSDTLLKEGFTMTPYECGKLIEAHRGNNPYIEEYQSLVRRLVLRERALFTSWGRRISFEGFRLDNELYKFAYSWTPQSEIGDMTNQKGLKPLHYRIKDYEMESDIILQCHDSVVVDAVPEEAYGIMCFLKRQMEKPRSFGECFGHEVELTIPTEFKVGLNWAKGKEWKYLPEKEEVETYIEELLHAKD